ncbi:hypothetical protein D1007_12239 [Hordeum vulgare]|nr:hypothetical protein D1007_12239 [Hordeum vulgare]
MARYRCGAVRISLGQVGMARGCADLAQSPVREASGGVGLHGRPAAAVCILRSGVADPASMLGLVLGRRRRAVAHRPARSGHVQAGSWLRRVVGEVRGCGCCSCVRVGHDLYLPDGGGARLLLDGGGRLHPRLDAGAGPDMVSAGPSSRRKAGGPAQWWCARRMGDMRGPVEVWVDLGLLHVSGCTG